MAEYINRDELVENLKKFAPEHYTDLINQLITKQPTADVVEVRHGEWIKHKRNIPKMREFHDKCMGMHMNEKSIFWICSCCNQWGNVHDKYCRVCGAKMDGGKDNGNL